MWPLSAITLSILVFMNTNNNHGSEAAPLSSCPKLCVCTKTELQCKSFNFLRELSDSSEAGLVTKLVVNNSTTSKIPRLDNLHNLKTLDLSSNKIKQLDSSYFPKSVEYLDLSRNLITHPPKDLHSTLTNLKELYLTGNPISCECDSISIRDQLLQTNVVIAKPVKCHSPESLHGKSWLTVSCVHDNDLFGEMQGDAPYEGSGSEEVVTAATDGESKSQDKSLEEEFIRVDSTTHSTQNNATKLNVGNENEEEEEEEGSGNSESTTPLIEIEYEDSNEDKNVEEKPVSEFPIVSVNDLLLNNVKACNFDCSTPAPPENDTDTDESPPPGVFEGVKILLDDFSAIRGPSTTTTSTEAPVITTTSKNDQDLTKKTDSEIVNPQISGEEKANIAEDPKQSNSSTYIFLGALLILIIALVLYAVIKKRSSNKRRRHSLNDNQIEKGVAANEVELLKANKPSNGTHEAAVPLMNGHSDKETKPYEDVELRQKPNEADEENTNLLVPETKRVTIKASEIPNSTPKTPILVTRHLNSDGSIVTTPTVHQKV